MAVYSEKIADNDRKIEQLSKNIKRDTEKRKKLMEENSRLLVPLLSARAELLGMTGDEKERYIAAVLTPGRDMTEGEI